MTETQKIVHKEVCKGRSPQNLMTLIDNLCAFGELFKRQYDLMNLTELSHAELANEVEKLLSKYHRKAQEIAERLAGRQEHSTNDEGTKPEGIEEKFIDMNYVNCQLNTLNTLCVAWQGRVNAKARMSGYVALGMLADIKRSLLLVDSNITSSIYDASNHYDSPSDVPRIEPRADTQKSIIQRINELEHSLAGTNSAISHEFAALAKDVVTLREEVERVTGCIQAPDSSGKTTYSVKLHINSDNTDVDENANDADAINVNDIDIPAVLHRCSQNTAPCGHKINNEGLIEFNGARMRGTIYATDGVFSGCVDSTGWIKNAFIADGVITRAPAPPLFKFALGEVVELELTGERGKVMSRADRLNSPAQYLVVYAGIGGRQEVWLDECELVAVPVDSAN